MRPIKGLSQLCLTPEKLSAEELMALTVALEAEDQGVLGQIAVGCVIRTRCDKKKKRYPQIILQKAQFSCWNDRALAEMRVGKIPKEILAQCFWVAQGVLNGALEDDVVKNADHYYNPDLAHPSWDDPKKRTVIIKDHVFLKLWS